MPPTRFAQHLLTWFTHHGRHDLPWQQNPTAYSIWVSEIMLQQTQVSTVIPYYQAFMQRFPDLATLAMAPLAAVLHQWAGLGYYARARHLHQTAQRLQQNHNGQFPPTLEAVMALPGIGRSTAGAILALAYHQPHPILDGNVKRVLSRFHAIAGWPGQAAVAQQLWQLATAHTPTHDDVAAYTQAIMDLGATVCTRQQPACWRCPVQADCQAWQTQTIDRYPQAKPKALRPVKALQLLMVFDETGRLYLELRPTPGIWAGLWSLPECPAQEDPLAWCQQRWQVTPTDLHCWPLIKHNLTHFQLQLTPILVKIGGTLSEPSPQQNSQQHWFSAQDIVQQQLALAKPIQDLVTRVFS